MLLQKLLSKTRRAVDDYSMIEEGDKIAVGLSGGKDSVTLLHLLASLRRFYPKKFEVVAITVDMGFKDTDQKEVESLKEMCKTLNVEYYIEPSQIGEIVFDIRKESNPCSLCAKLRRGALNSTAVKYGCNKVALGHHGDDLVETFFLSMFYEGRLSTFQPVTKLERANIEVIRPMIYLREKEISSFAKDQPVLHNPCPANKHTEREYIKTMFKEVGSHIPIAKERVLGALVHPERNNLISPKQKKD